MFYNINLYKLKFSIYRENINYDRKDISTFRLKSLNF